MIVRDTKSSAARGPGFSEPRASGEEPALRPTEIAADIVWVFATGAAMAAVVLIIGWTFNQ
jgi:hypothetical protein